MKGDDWTLDALCAETDPEVFFPEKGGSTEPAKAICAQCDVRETCLTWALERGERFGVWGGQSERERRKIAKERGIVVVTPRMKAIAMAEQGLEVWVIAERLGAKETTVYSWLHDAEVAA